MNTVIEFDHVHPDKPGLVLSATANKTEIFSKVVKIAVPLFEIISIIFEYIPGADLLSNGFKLLKQEFSFAKEVTDATNVIDTGSGWLNPKKCAENCKRPEKAISRISLTFAHAVNAVGFIDKYSVGFFSQASMMVGQIPIISLVMNTLVVISSGFGIWNSSLDLEQANQAADKASEKLKKWNFRVMEFGDFDKFDKAAVIAKCKAKLQGYKEGSEKYQRKQDYLSILENKTVSIKESVQTYQDKKLQRRLEKYQDQNISKNECETRQKYVSVLENGRIDLITDYKVKKYEANLEASHINQNKSWIAIWADITKIAVVILGLTAAAFATVVPVLGTVGATIIISTLGIITNSIGVAKTFYSDPDIGPKAPSLPELVVP